MIWQQTKQLTQFLAKLMPDAQKKKKHRIQPQHHQKLKEPKLFQAKLMPAKN